MKPKTFIYAIFAITLSVSIFVFKPNSAKADFEGYFSSASVNPSSCVQGACNVTVSGLVQAGSYDVPCGGGGTSENTSNPKQLGVNSINISGVSPNGGTGWTQIDSGTPGQCNVTTDPYRPARYQLNYTFNLSSLPAGVHQVVLNVSESPQSFSDPSVYTANSSPANLRITINAASPAIVYVTSNVSTSWVVSGPSGFSGSGTSNGGAGNTVTAGSYSIAAPSLACYSGPSVNNGNPQSVNNGGSITFDLFYTSDGSCGGYPTASYGTPAYGTPSYITPGYVTPGYPYPTPYITPYPTPAPSGSASISCKAPSDVIFTYPCTPIFPGNTVRIGINWNNQSRCYLNRDFRDLSADADHASTVEGWIPPYTGQIDFPFILFTSTNFELGCEDLVAGNWVYQSAYVEVIPNVPPSCTLSANPATISQGGYTDLTWTSEDATLFWIDPGLGFMTPASGGTIRVWPAGGPQTLTYTGNAHGNGGTTQCTAIVNIVAAQGTVNVTSDLPSGNWCVIGPSPTCGSGAYTNSNSNPGSYSANVSPPSGYAALVVPSGTQSLGAGGTITFDAHYLAKPTGVAVDNSVCSKLTVSWTDNSNNEQGFTVWRSLSSGGSFANVSGNLAANTTSWQDTPPASETIYYYQVRSYRNFPPLLEATSAPPPPSANNRACLPDLGQSSKSITAINGGPYSGSAVIKSGDTLTFNITIVNSGFATATITPINDLLSNNLISPRNLRIDKDNDGIYNEAGETASACIPAVDGPSLAPGICGTLPNIKLKVSGNKAAGNPNWVVRFDVTVNISGLDLFDLLSNSATINWTDAQGPHSITRTVGPIIITNGRARVPQFREVAP